MKLPDTIKQALADRNYDDIETRWLKMMSERDGDLDLFAAVADALVEGDEADRARTLLELLDDQLKEQGGWERRLQLIRYSGRHYLKSGRVFDTVLESVRALYGDSPEELEVLLPLVGLDKGREETTKLWDKVERLRSLLAYRVGIIVVMQGQGVGRVTEVNLDLQTLRVDFELVKGMAVGFRAAAKLLEPLPAGHVLRRKLEDPAALAALAPADLLRETLTSYDRPLSGAEIRAIVKGIVPDERWSSWWSVARKHPQMLTEGGKRQVYSWAQSSGHARDAVWQAFEAAGLRDQLELLRRLAKDDSLRPEMIAAVALRTEQLAADQPALAFEGLLALERSGAAAAALTAPDLIAGLADVPAFLRALPQRPSREQAYLLLRQTRADWPTLLEAAFIEEEDPRLLDVLARLFREHAEADFRRVCDRATAQPRRTPGAFVWFAERAADEEGRAQRSFRLLRQILQALSDETFTRYRPRLLALCESGGTVPRILAALQQPEAAETLELIKSARLEPYQREPLVNAILLRFPALDGERQMPFYTTASMLERKREELRALVEEELPANRRAIEEARAHGDLRENFEYKAARQRHEYLSARAEALHRQLDRAQVLDPKAIDASEVRIGTRALLRGMHEQPRAITILGPWESDPDAGVVSFESDVARRIIGKRAGDRIELDGVTLTIESIAVFDASD